MSLTLEASKFFIWQKMMKLQFLKTQSSQVGGGNKRFVSCCFVHFRDESFTNVVMKSLLRLRQDSGRQAPPWRPSRRTPANLGDLRGYSWNFLERPGWDSDTFSLFPVCLLPLTSLTSCSWCRKWRRALMTWKVTKSSSKSQKQFRTSCCDGRSWFTSCRRIINPAQTLTLLPAARYCHHGNHSCVCHSLTAA